jgi:fibronectin type 3 domain-containing protein
VYGLLPVPGAEKLAAPTGGKVELKDGNVLVTWDAVPSATVYRVQRTSSLEPRSTALAMGLTTTKYVEPAPERGESLSYTIFAVGNDGVSGGSASVTVAPQKAVPVED